MEPQKEHGKNKIKKKKRIYLMRNFFPHVPLEAL